MINTESKKHLIEAYKKIDPYQPLYGQKVSSISALRKTDDRCESILNYFDNNVSGVKFLDIGCNAGFASFYLADRGAIVTGWDYLEDNIQVCNELKHINKISVNFELQELSLDSISKIKNNQYDVALILNVLHWTTNEKGIDYVQECVRQLFSKIPTLIVELAYKNEVSGVGIYDTAPENILSVFDKIEGYTIKKIGEFSTHQKYQKRPMYVISK